MNIVGGDGPGVPIIGKVPSVKAGPIQLAAAIEGVMGQGNNLSLALLVTTGQLDALRLAAVQVLRERGVTEVDKL